MRPEQWALFKAVAKGTRGPQTPLALIVDSPWFPGYAGTGHLDYYLDAGTWFRANHQFAREFPDVIPFPGWWVEYGMAIEPSAMGSRIRFHSDQPPSQMPSLVRLADVEKLAPVDPWSDGLMALALHRYRRDKQRIFDGGYTIPVVTARGPVCSAAFLRGLNELMVDLTDDPEGVHRLLEFTTAAIIRWLKAQAEAIGSSVDGLFILDDVVGFLSRRAYLEFAQPYLHRICTAFPSDWVKVYHNDANVRPFLADLPDAGFDVLNWTHNVGFDEAARKLCGRMRLMGNVDPLKLGVRGTPAEVKAAALDVLGRASGGSFILSLGGGVSPGMPRENIAAMIGAVREFDERARP